VKELTLDTPIGTTVFCTPVKARRVYSWACGDICEGHELTAIQDGMVWAIYKGRECGGYYPWRFALENLPPGVTSKRHTVREVTP
jgi:hypothetical protein